MKKRKIFFGNKTVGCGLPGGLISITGLFSCGLIFGIKEVSRRKE